MTYGMSRSAVTMGPRTSGASHWETNVSQASGRKARTRLWAAHRDDGSCFSRLDLSQNDLAW